MTTRKAIWRGRWQGLMLDRHLSGMKPLVGRSNDEMALRLMIASQGLRRGWIEVAEEMRLHERREQSRRSPVAPSE